MTYSLTAVVERGKAHGARAEDIYGCLYFYLSDELRLFAERIQRFRISFKVLGFEALHLSKIILGNELVTYGIPASIKFDRIEVSNILDNNYVGIEGVLTAWAPLLRKNRSCAIIGYFMNWVATQPDGCISNLGKDGLRRSLIQQREVRVNEFAWEQMLIYKQRWEKALNRSRSIGLSEHQMTTAHG
jgi:hypothetical protein